MKQKYNIKITQTIRPTAMRGCSDVRFEIEATDGIDTKIFKQTTFVNELEFVTSNFSNAYKLLLEKQAIDVFTKFYNELFIK